MTQLVAEFYDGTYDKWYHIRIDGVLTYRMMRESFTHEWVLRNLLNPNELTHKSQYRNDVFSWLEAKYQTHILHINKEA